MKPGLALPAALVVLFLGVSPVRPAVAATPEGFGITITGEPPNEGRAGSHPRSMVTTVAFDEDGEGGSLRRLELELPAGLIENPGAVEKCSQARFHTPRVSPFEASESGESCQPLSQVGVVQVRIGGETRSFGLFNLIPPPGAPSQIGFSPFGIPITLTPRIRQAGGEYGTTLELSELPPEVDLQALTMTIWGSPWAASHNAQRGQCLNEAEPDFGFAKCPVVAGERPHLPFAYLTLPTTCQSSLAFNLEAVSRQGGLTTATALGRDPTGAPVALSGCKELRFEPLTQGGLTNPRASSPSGFDFSLTPKEEALTAPGLDVPSQTRTAVVALPEGMTLNPSLAAGLASCTPGQYAAETATSPIGVGCPEESKIGSFTVQSPLFQEPEKPGAVEAVLKGGIYLAEPDEPATRTPGAENPFDSLVAIYLIATLPERGVIVKVAGRLDLDPVSGRPIATFDDLPQLPYSRLLIHFREGQRAPLVAPSACGTFTTVADLSPWNEPAVVDRSSSSFSVAKGIGAGEACPGGGAAPFSPGAVGGMLNAAAGSWSSFYLHLTRPDSEQELTSYSTTLPPGLTGRIAGIPYCPDAAIAAAKTMSGREEEARPSCPAASEIGHTLSGYGAGSVLAYAPGRLYLAGPYHGSAFSVVAIDSATVGPFDLGVIVIRSAIRVDSHTAQVSIDSAGSDPIPHILGGVPIHLRDVRVYIDRPQTMLNPTSCAPQTLTAILTGAGGGLADVPSHFQVSNCSALGFAPKLGLRLHGGHRRGQFPSLTATLTPRPGDANIGRAEVTLPSSIFLAQENIDRVCTNRQFETDTCPPRSVYGQASAVTPLLAQPLRGDVYLRASKTTLPDLAVILRGDGIRIDLTGRIDSRHGGIRATFDLIPDAPVTQFSLRLKGGAKRGLLVAAADLCAKPQYALARLLGQDNDGRVGHPQVRSDCGGKGR